MSRWEMYPPVGFSLRENNQERASSGLYRGVDVRCFETLEKDTNDDREHPEHPLPLEISRSHVASH